MHLTICQCAIRAHSVHYSNAYYNLHLISGRTCCYLVNHPVSQCFPKVTSQKGSCGEYFLKSRRANAEITSASNFLLKCLLEKWEVQTKCTPKWHKEDFLTYDFSGVIEFESILYVSWQYEWCLEMLMYQEQEGIKLVNSLQQYLSRYCKGQYIVCYSIRLKFSAYKDFTVTIINDNHEIIAP